MQTKTPKRKELVSQISSYFGYNPAILQRKTLSALRKLWNRIDTPEVQNHLKKFDKERPLPEPYNPNDKDRTR